MDKGVWKEAVRKDAHQKIVGSCNRYEGRICAEKGEGISVVKRGERRSKGVCKRTAEEGLHSAVEITTNGAGVLCGEEGWEEEDGSGLLIPE